MAHTPPDKPAQLLLHRSMIATAISLALATQIEAATINVDATCSLVEAITTANGPGTAGSCEAGSASGADTIVLPSSSVIPLTSYNNSTDGFNGLPSITSSITIQGNNSLLNRVGAQNFRLFHIASNGNLTLDHLTVSGGIEVRGGGLFNRGTLTLESSTVTGNSATFQGGGMHIVATASVTLNNSTV